MDFKSLINYFLCKIHNYKNKLLFELPIKLRGEKFFVLGNNIKIRSNARIECIEKFANEKMNPKLIIGDNVIINNSFYAYVVDEVRIGKDTIIAANVLITTENHGINPELKESYAKQKLTHSKVMIGENVWIGQNVVILPNVSIGNGAIIGAGAVVTKNVPEYSMVVGNPGRIIKKYDFVNHEWRKIERK